MKTLSKKITNKFFKHETGFYCLEKIWSEIINSDKKKELTAIHYFLYLALRGKNWRRGFILPGREKDIINGRLWNSGAYRCIKSICHLKKCLKTPNYKWNSKYIDNVLWPFKELITDNAIEELEKLLPKASVVTTSIEFEPYVIEESIEEKKGLFELVKNLFKL